MTNSTAHITAQADDWDRHWKDYAEAAEQNPAQRYRRRIIARLLASETLGSAQADAPRILDIGSGQGDLAQRLHAIFPQAELAGVELSAMGVAEASAKVPGARFFQRDLLAAQQDPTPLRAWADYAICSEVLEHLDDPAMLLRHASEYLAPGCLLIVTVPGGPQSEFDRHIGHRQHFTPASLRALLAGCGFSVETATTAGFPFFNLYRLAVILRGRRLIADVQSGSHGTSNWLARGVMALFDGLFSLNIMGTGMGWQTVAAARWAGPDARMKR